MTKEVNYYFCYNKTFINIKLLYTVANMMLLIYWQYLVINIIRKKLIGNVGTWTCVADISQQPCHPCEEKDGRMGETVVAYLWTWCFLWETDGVVDSKAVDWYRRRKFESPRCQWGFLNDIPWLNIVEYYYNINTTLKTKVFTFYI